MKPQKQKRAVGRPKKEKKEESPKPKRGVGRPKKSDNSDVDILKHLGESLIAASEKKTKRGAKKS